MERHIPTAIAKCKVVTMSDYGLSRSIDTVTGAVTSRTLPQSNVLADALVDRLTQAADAMLKLEFFRKLKNQTKILTAENYKLLYK